MDLKYWKHYLKYYKKTILNTMITFKGPNRIKIEEINNRGKVSE